MQRIVLWNIRARVLCLLQSLTQKTAGLHFQNNFQHVTIFFQIIRLPIYGQHNYHDIKLKSAPVLLICLLNAAESGSDNRCCTVDLQLRRTKQIEQPIRAICTLRRPDALGEVT